VWKYRRESIRKLMRALERRSLKLLHIEIGDADGVGVDEIMTRLDEATHPRPFLGESACVISTCGSE
jgi:hypothetical protein